MSGFRAMRVMLLSFGMMVAASARPAAAQVRQVDPDQAIDGDLSSSRAARPDARTDTSPDAPAIDQRDDGRYAQEPSSRDDTERTAPVARTAGDVGPGSAQARAGSAVQGRGDTYHQDDLIGAATGVFGKGAKGIAGVIEGILKKQGEPNGYIVGREGGGAFVAGLRYGSGTLYHKLEGERPVYWTGPSIGFDAGANVGSAFVLVYNLYDTEDLYKRFVAGEGQAYFIGGFNVSYMRHGSVVLIPVRLGAGLRLGANVGYMKFSHKQTWLPF